MLKFGPIWQKLLQILKNGPVHVPKFVKKKKKEKKKKESLIYQWGWFCYPCLWHVPKSTFVTKYPPGIYTQHYLHAQYFSAVMSGYPIDQYQNITLSVVPLQKLKQSSFSRAVQVHSTKFCIHLHMIWSGCNWAMVFRVN